MPKHNPLAFAASLSSKLAARSRHICTFFGAGVSSACGLPDVAQLRSLVLSNLENSDRELLERQLEGRNLESALSRLRKISALISGEETVDGLTGERASALDKAICKAIVNALDLKNANLTPVNNFAAWCARADYHLPVEIFTVNYDLLLETALENSRVPYFDGFIGSMRARFHTQLVEGSPGSDREWMPPFFVRLWKLHGSVNWAWQDDNQIFRIGQPVSEDRVAAIYPSDTKYEESRRVPFVVLQDRLRRALYQAETLIIVAGYSFGDDHLNDFLFDAAAKRERSEFLIFCYSEIPDILARKAEITPNIQVAGSQEGILGGVRSEWSAPDNPPPNLWVNDKFALCDFRNLSSYLARSSNLDSTIDLLRPMTDDSRIENRANSAGENGNL